MARYIDADLILPEMESKFDMQDLYLPINFQEMIIDDIPTADVAPAKHAKWEYGKLHGQSGYYCSECGAGFEDTNPNAEWIAKSHDYCPKCGAKMDGDTK